MKMVYDKRNCHSSNQLDPYDDDDIFKVDFDAIFASLSQLANKDWSVKEVDAGQVRNNNASKREHFFTDPSNGETTNNEQVFTGHKDNQQYPEKYEDLDKETRLELLDPNLKNMFCNYSITSSPEPFMSTTNGIDSSMSLGSTSRIKQANSSDNQTMMTSSTTAAIHASTLRQNMKPPSCISESTRGHGQQDNVSASHNTRQGRKETRFDVENTMSRSQSLDNRSQNVQRNEAVEKFDPFKDMMDTSQNMKEDVDVECNAKSHSVKDLIARMESSSKQKSTNSYVQKWGCKLMSLDPHSTSSGGAQGQVSRTTRRNSLSTDYTHEPTLRNDGPDSRVHNKSSHEVSQDPFNTTEKFERQQRCNESRASRRSVRIIPVYTDNGQNHSLKGVSNKQCHQTKSFENDPSQKHTFNTTNEGKHEVTNEGRSCVNNVNELNETMSRTQNSTRTTEKSARKSEIDLQIADIQNQFEKELDKLMNIDSTLSHQSVMNKSRDRMKTRRQQKGNKRVEVEEERFHAVPMHKTEHVSEGTLPKDNHPPPRPPTPPVRELKPIETTSLMVPEITVTNTNCGEKVTTSAKSQNEHEHVQNDSRIFMNTPTPSQGPIMYAARDLHKEIGAWSTDFSSRGEEEHDIIMTARRSTYLMASLSRILYQDRSEARKELIDVVNAIHKSSNHVFRLASMLASTCSDKKIKTNLYNACQPIPTIASQLKILSTVKAALLGTKVDGEVREATDMLVGNARNLMKTIKHTITVAKSASIKIRTDVNGPQCKWEPKQKPWYEY